MRTFLLRNVPVAPPIYVTHSESNDTFRRVRCRSGNTAPYASYMHSSDAFLRVENAIPDVVAP